MSNKKQNRWLIFGALLGLVSVGMGAFGAHALQDVLTPHYKEVFGTASRYALIHAVLISVLAISSHKIPKSCFWFFSLGVLVFSGTLWILATTQIKIFGAITPIGGTLLLLGWGRLAWWGKDAKL